MKLLNRFILFCCCASLVYFIGFNLPIFRVAIHAKVLRIINLKECLNLATDNCYYTPLKTRFTNLPEHFSYVSFHFYFQSHIFYIFEKKIILIFWSLNL